MTLPLHEIPMNRPGSEVLFSAIKRGDLAAVRAAIEQGVDVNETRTDIYPLLLAVREKQVEIARLLIDEGAWLDAPNNFGWTALLEATRSGQMAMVQMMDEYELDLKVASSRGDGLMHAAVQGDTQGMVPYFAERGVNIDRANRNRVTPVMLAAEQRRAATFRELVSLGADLDRTDSAGVSARQRAQDWAEGQEILRTTVPGAVASPSAAPAAPVVEAVPAPAPALGGIRKRSSGMH